MSERPRRRVLAALAGLLLAAGALGAQETEYTIGVGDRLEITVWQRPDLSARVPVDPQGNVTLPLIGSVRAAGQTPARLGRDLTRRYSFVDRDVSQVTVTVTGYDSRRVFVMGEVQSPGPYSFAEIPGVWQVIREAGGPTAEAALARVRVIPPEGSGRPLVVDLETVLATGDFASLPALRPGSTILVPRIETAGPEGDVVHVYGSVNRPGTFSIDEAGSVLEAVLAAGGPRNDASMGHVRVVRPGPMRARVFEVDLHDYVDRGELFANLELRPGDTVTVPRSRGHVVWNAFRDVMRVSGSVFATIFFFLELGDDNTTTTNPAPSAAPAAGVAEEDAGP